MTGWATAWPDALYRTSIYHQRHRPTTLRKPEPSCECRRYAARSRAAQPSLLAGEGRTLGVFLDIDEWRRSVAHPSSDFGCGGSGLEAAASDHRSSCRLQSAAGQGARTPASASAIAYEAAMALYDDVFGSHAFAADRSAMQIVIDHIDANLDKPLPVEELAKVSGLSRAHFSRVFAESEGVPPAEFVLQQRMQRAAKLLTKAAFIPVKEVAIMSGFDDANYFSKVFRRIYGINPTEFRTTGMYAAVRSPVEEGKTSRSR